MLIILDTTETFKDFRLTNPDVEVLASCLAKQAGTLAVPEIVVRETINHYRESLRETYKSAEKKLAELARLAGTDPIPLSGIDLHQLENTYSDDLHRRLLELGATQLNYEGIGLESLIHRALSRRKPFDSKGRVGFRDAVLWETILRTAKERPEPIVFVTRNSQDFGEHGHLASDLKEDLRRLGLPLDRVTVCSGLDRFAKEYAVPLESSGGNRPDESTQTPVFNPERFFRESEDGIYAELERAVLDHRDKYEDMKLEDLRVCPSETSVHSVWRLKDNRAAAHVSYVAKGTITYTSKGAYDWLLPSKHIERRAQFQIDVSVLFEESTGATLKWRTQDVHVRLGKKRSVAD